MNLLGAEQGRVQLISAPIDVAVVEGDSAAIVRARLKWVPPKVEAVAKICAEFYLRTLAGRQPARDDIEREQRMLMMSWACRRDDGAYSNQVFTFPAVMDDKNRVVPQDELLFQVLHDAPVRLLCADPGELWNAYGDFLAAELPPYPSPAQVAELLEDAKKNSLSTLLSARGYWPLLRLLRGMGRQLGAFDLSSTGGGSA